MDVSRNPLSISIVIPACNEECYIGNCLQSIAKQAVKPHDVIVVDNNSTDSTARIARSFPFVKVISDQNQGTVYARNAGFDAAQGNVIGRIDADTCLPPDWVENLQRIFTKRASVAAVTGRCYFYDFPFPSLTCRVHESLYYFVQNQLAGTEILWGSNMAIRADAWQKVHARCSALPDIPEDIDLSLCLQESGYKIARDSTLLATVSLRRGSLTPLAVLRYLKWWPRVYRQHRRYFAATLVSMLYIIFCLLTFILWPVVAIYRSFRKGPD